MPNQVSAVIGSTDYGSPGENKVTVFTVQPAGIGVLGTADLTIQRLSGGYTILPMQRVKLARLDNSNNMSPRLLQGIVAYLETTQVRGTVAKEWMVRCQDVNLLGLAIGTPLSFTTAAFTGTYAAQISKIVGDVQNAYGVGWEAIDATSQVAGLYGSFTMPAMEGGHPLNWYIDQINLKVYELSGGTVVPAYYYGMDTDVGVTTTFGAAVLVAYDSASLPAASATYSTQPGPGERTIRAGSWKRQLDASTLYVRRQALYNGGSVTGYNSTANTAYPNPWSPGGWWKEPDKYDVSTSAEAQALIDSDVASNSNPLETVTFLTDDAIHVPGDVIAITHALEGLSNEKYRIIRTRVIFESSIADYPLTEITAGLLPRGLGRNRIGGTIPTLLDRVPPVAPASAPTLLFNGWSGGGGGENRTYVRLKTVNSISADVGAHRLRLVISGRLAYFSPWITATGPGPLETTFPTAEVPPGASIVASVFARDTSGNEQATAGPSLTFTAAKKPVVDGVGFEGAAAYDIDGGAAGIAGWNRSALTGTASAARVTTAANVYFGTASLGLTVSATSGHLIEYEGPPILAQSSKLWELMIARKATAATGTAAFLVRCYDSADVLVSTITVWSATPTTSFVEIPDANRTLTLPASIAYFVPVLRYTSTGTGATLYWSIDVARWKIKQSVVSLGTDVKTDSTWPNWDVSINPWQLYNGSGNPILSARYNAGTPATVITSTNAGNQLELHSYNSDSTVVLGDTTEGVTIQPKLTVTGNAIISANLEVVGTSLFTGDVQFDGNANFTSDLQVGTILGPTGGALTIGSGLNLLRVAKSATFTADHLAIVYDCQNSITCNLPSASTTPVRVYVINNVGTGVVTIDPNGAELIAGHSTWPLAPGASLTIYSDAVGWRWAGGVNHNRGATLPTTGLYAGLTYDYIVNGLCVPVVYNSTISGWLGPETPIAIHNYIGGPPFSSNSEVLATSLRNDRALYITRYTASWYTGGGVDASNYWRLYLRRLNSGIGFDNIVYIQTNNNGWTKAADKVPADMSNNPCATGDIWLQLYAEKTGTPNPVYIQAQVHGCYIYT